MPPELPRSTVRQDEASMVSAAAATMVGSSSPSPANSLVSSWLSGSSRGPSSAWAGSSSGLRSSSSSTKAVKLDVGELQELDRLLQLRRHHQGLALAQVELRREGHGVRLV